ncbi:hypothetical protein [Xanthomonas phage DES1]|nr:hypothetical protein [Xanthomonas phage DES1]
MSEVEQKVNITLTSLGQGDEVALSVTFDPPMTGDDIKAQGYYPASFQFFDHYIMPAISDAFGEGDVEEEQRAIN